MISTYSFDFCLVIIANDIKPTNIVEVLLRIKWVQSGVIDIFGEPIIAHVICNNVDHKILNGDKFRVIFGGIECLPFLYYVTRSIKRAALQQYQSGCLAHRDHCRCIQNRSGLDQQRSEPLARSILL
jgi:hypothetical protein